MGNKASTYERHIDIKDIKDNYQYDKKFADTRFGDIKLLTNKTNNAKVFQKDHTTNTQMTHEEFLKVLEAKKSLLIHPNLLYIYGYNTQKDEVFCSEAYKTSIFFEHFERDLEQEISKREKTKDYFKEFEMWLILDSLVSACAFLQQNGLYHGDLRPFNVFITAENQYKLAERILTSSSSFAQNVLSIKDLQSKEHYPSPQAFQSLKEKDPTSVKYSIDKNDVFGLGMTLLEAALLEKTADIYDHKNYEMNQAILNERLGHLRDLYSENLINIIRAALDFDENFRPDFIDLDNILEKYRADIQRNKTPLPSYQTDRELIVEGMNQQQKETVKSAGVATSDRSEVSLKFPDEDLERRINEAIARSDATILKFSPKKKPQQQAPPTYDTPLYQDFNKVGITESPVKAGYVVDSQNYEPYSPQKVSYQETVTVTQTNYGNYGNYGDVQNNPEGGDINKKIEDILSQSKKGTY